MVLSALDEALADLQRLNLSRSGLSPRPRAQCRHFQGPTSEFDLQPHDFLHVKQRFGACIHDRVDEVKVIVPTDAAQNDVANT